MIYKLVCCLGRSLNAMSDEITSRRACGGFRITIVFRRSVNNAQSLNHRKYLRSSSSWLRLPAAAFVLFVGHSLSAAFGALPSSRLAS